MRHASQIVSLQRHDGADVRTATPALHEFRADCPSPSSPTLPVSSTSTAGTSPAIRSSSASLIAAATATLLSPTPGPVRRSVGPLDAPTACSIGNTVSMCAATSSDLRRRRPRGCRPGIVADHVPEVVPLGRKTGGGEESLDEERLRRLLSRRRRNRRDQRRSVPARRESPRRRQPAPPRSALVRPGSQASPAHATGVAHSMRDSRRRPENATTAVSRLGRR